MTEPMSSRLAAQLRLHRRAKNWTLEDLAEMSGVSRATLSRIEKREVSPTADVLAKICQAFGTSMSRFLLDVEDTFQAHVPQDTQTFWLDPGSGLRRRNVSPPAQMLLGEVLECELPAGATIEYEDTPEAGLEHHLVMLDGRLSLTVGDEAHHLNAGDALRYRLFGGSRFQTPHDTGARYMLVLVSNQK